MKSEEAMSHVVSSADYWSSGDYPNNKEYEDAFWTAIKHVKRSHHYELNAREIIKCKLAFDKIIKTRNKGEKLKE